MARHSSKERVGVHKTAIFFEEEFGWIFREQKETDVGVDSIVEKSEKGIPKGNFIALQIKSGAGNFYKSTTGYVYYISKVHYYYWINLDLPVLLIGYFPQENYLLWREIIPENLIKTRTQWKIELPFENILTKESFEKLNKITKISQNSKLNPYSNLLKISGREKYLSIIKSLHLLRYYQEILVQEITEEKPKIESFKKNPKDNNRKNILKSNQISILENFALRCELEIDIFALMNSEFLKATIAYVEMNKSKSFFRKKMLLEGIKQVDILIEDYILNSNSMNGLLDSLNTYKKRDLFGNGKSVKNAENSIKKIQTEFMNAGELCKELKDLLKSLK